jgi:hypothetical protein
VAGIDQRELDKDIRKLGNTLDRVSRIMGKDVNELIKQTAIFSLQSATKATKPGSTSKVSKLPKKFRFRPLVKIPASFGFYYSRDGETVFKTKEKLNLRKAENAGIKALKGIKFWNKKTKSFGYMPYIGEKRDESDKRFKIPGAGAAKVGWLKALKKLNKKAIDVGTNRGGKPFNRVFIRQGLIDITNLVKYASKTSPNAARVGLAKGARRLEKSWLPKVERRIERDWRKQTNSFVKAIGRLA